MFCSVEVEYSVSDGQDEATALLSVIVRQTVNDLIGPVAFVGEPRTYVNEPMHFVYLAARSHSAMKYEIEYGDGTLGTSFDAAGRISPIPHWAGAAAGRAFGKDTRQCHGSVLEHVYKSVGIYTARARATADQHSAGERFDELVLTATVNADVRPRTLGEVMSFARVYRRLPNYDDEFVLMLFRADEFPESLSLSVDFGGNEEPLTVKRMSGDSIPSWFTSDRFEDITTRTSEATDVASKTVSSDSTPFFGVQVGKLFARPGTYDVPFRIRGTLPHAEAPQRVLIVARVDVREKRLERQLAGGPLIFAHSPVSSGTTAELLVVLRRLVLGVDLSIDFGDDTSEPVTVNVLQTSDLPNWLLAGQFSSPEPWVTYPTGRSVTYGSVVRHLFREPGFYVAVAKAIASSGDHCEAFTSPATLIHVVDRSTPPLSKLLGDDALVVPTPLLSEAGFQAFYIATRNVTDARYSFIFGDGTGQIEGRGCSEWPHIDDSNRTIAGRLPLDDARKGSAATAVCVSHVYANPGNYTVRVRVLAPPSGVLQKTWNLGGRVTVLPLPSPTMPTTPVRSFYRVSCRCFAVFVLSSHAGAAEA